MIRLTGGKGSFLFYKRVFCTWRLTGGRVRESDKERALLGVQGRVREREIRREPCSECRVG